jgi:hypothetical protein
MYEIPEALDCLLFMLHLYFFFKNNLYPVKVLKTIKVRVLNSIIEWTVVSSDYRRKLGSVRRKR